MKKSILFLAVLVLVLPFVLMACAVPPAEGVTPGTLNDVQLYVIGVIASVVVYMLKIAAERFPHWTIRREWLSVCLYLAAWALSIFWGGVSLPAFGAFADPVTFVSALFTFISSLLVALGPSVAFATLIYNVLLKKALDGLQAKLIQ